MEVPKYIENALKKRAQAAFMYLENDFIIFQWCEKNDVPVEECDILTGCESIVNPADSAMRILNAIRNK